MKKLILSLVVLVSSTVIVSARTKPPVLIIRDPVRKVYRPLSIHDLKIRVRVFGNIAETTMDLTFYNDLNRRLEGRFVFPLPQGSRVSRFALEVKGRLREGVVVGRHKGRKVFEKIVRSMIDPGLLEWTRGNNFRARVYPVPAKGYKRLVVAWQHELKWHGKALLYRLPLLFPYKIANFEVRAEVFRQQAYPELGIPENSLKEIYFKKWQDQYTARFRRKNFKPGRGFAFRLPRTKAYQSVLVEKDSRDGNFAFYAHMVPSILKTMPLKPKKVLLVWDASSSMHLRKTKLELRLLDRYFRNNPELSVELLLLRNTVEKGGVFRMNSRGRAALLRKLKRAPLDGATSFDTLQLNRFQADMVILSTDGLDTFGRGAAGMKRGNAPVYVLASSEKSDHYFLRNLSASTGGVYLNLDRLKTNDAQRLLSSKPFSFIKTEIISGSVTGLTPDSPVPLNGDFSVSGILHSGRAVLRLHFGVKGDTAYTKTVILRRRNTDTGGIVPRLHAQKRIDRLMVHYDNNRNEIQKLAQKYTIVTRDTSLIVLERLSDYVKYKITPPTELTDAWKQALTRIRVLKKKKQFSHLEKVVRMFDALRMWWEKKYPLDTPKIIPTRKKASERVGARSRSERRRFSNNHATGASSPRDNRDMTVRRPASGKKDSKSRVGSSGIQLKKWDPQTPYLKKLRAVAEESLYPRYLLLKKKYGNSSAFFLDVADLFIKKGKKKLALRILSCIAEMRLENPQLLRILGHRLSQLGFNSLAVTVFKRVKEMRPEDPQSFRDLALVLNRTGAHQQAVGLLYKVATTSWDSRFPEIELIALNEMNSIIARHPGKVDTGNLDSRLVKRMPVDVRVILTWDADNCDMDLWVTDPNREKCYYSHRKTYQGGRMSRDFTRGYGPEEYMVRRAKDGKYLVQVNYYGNSQQIIAGATTVQMKLFLNFGRKNQSVKEITLRLKDKKEVVTVGGFRIRFGHR